jgi:hypothetical protein
MLEGLVQKLEPVRPIPQLWSLFLMLALIFGVAVVLNLLWVGLSFRPLSAWLHAPFLVLLIGLVVTAGGSMLAAVSGAIPGREGLARGGRRTAWAGALVASLGGGLGLAAADNVVAQFPLSITLACAWRASALGAVPAAALCVYLARAFERRPGMGAIFACVGAVTMGAGLVHASCPAGDARHLLVGHWVAPLGLALLLALPFSLLIRQLAPGSRSSRE